MDNFLRISTSIYLALVVLVKMMAMPISLAEYSLNKKYIAANLCENRTNTAIECGGKCFLNKKLARSNDSQDAQNNKGGFKIISVDYCEHRMNLSFYLKAEVLLHNSAPGICTISSRDLSSVFRPPIFCQQV